MASPNASWDIQDQNDRIISVLAWVVVAVLVIYASVYFYRQTLGIAHRPVIASHKGSDRSSTGGVDGVRPLSTGDPAPEQPPANPAQGVPDEPAPAEVGPAVSHRPATRPSTMELATVGQGEPRPVRSPDAGPPVVASAASGAHAAAPAGYAIRVNRPFASAREAHQLLFSLPVVVQDVEFPKEGDSYFLQLGPFASEAEALPVLTKMLPHVPEAKIVALGPKGATGATSKGPGRRPPAKRPPAGAGDRPAADRQTAENDAARLGRGARDADVPSPPRPVQRAATSTQDKPRRPARQPSPSPKRSSPTPDEPDESSTTEAQSEIESVLKAPAVTRHGVRGSAAPTTAVDPVETTQAPEPRETDEGQARPDEGTTTPRSKASPSDPESRGPEVASPAAAEEQKPRGRYAVQIGAYASEDKARTLAGDLRTKGIAAKVDEATTGERTLWRVRVGSYGDFRAASAAARRVSGELGFKETRIIQY
ncbi:MAG: SPOR domain-containing protein [Candidatus Riflebacteria bacterium]|nr:SPOR domain-containing protein [Candidatus Riflebacteria bacterium]